MVDTRSNMSLSSNTSSSSEDDDVLPTSVMDEESRFLAIMKRFDKMDKKQDKISKKLKKLDDIEKKVNKQEENHTQLSNIVSNQGLKVNELEEKVGQIQTLEEQYKTAIRKTQISQVTSDFMNKRVNVIIRNYPEDPKNAWENKDDSIKNVRKVLKHVLKLDEADTMVIADAHRLPAKKGRRPLIFKLASLVDKNKLWKNVKNTKEYNNGKDEADVIKIDMVHLPKKLSTDKFDLLDDFFAAKNKGDKPKWWFDRENGQYCYMIADIVYRPSHDNFVPKATVTY